MAALGDTGTVTGVAASNPLFLVEFAQTIDAGTVASRGTCSAKLMYFQGTTLVNITLPDTYPDPGQS